MTSFFVASALIAIILSTYLLEYNQIKILNQKREVEDLVEMKSTLINILAHDLRSPCNSIVGFSNLYIKDPGNFEVADTKFFMENINKSANNLLSLLQNLLEWSRMQTNNYTFNPTVIPLDELVAANIQMARGALELKSISLRKTEDDSGLQVVADKNMIDTVFRNLLSNAIKFTREGGKIDLKYWSTGNLACVAIIDNGVGIDMNRIETLFEITSSGSTKGTNNESGSGLGLVLCHEFIVKNDGHIWVKSNKGEGTTFTFTLPLKQTG
ncbi:MAG: HAMP domain-containing sensor histidine kinase [Cyclobacteriaceae bacterium]